MSTTVKFIRFCTLGFLVSFALLDLDSRSIAAALKPTLDVEKERSRAEKQLQIAEDRTKADSLSASADADQALTFTGRLGQNSQVLAEDNSYYNAHTLEGTEGEFVVIDMSSTEFDTFLTLLDPQGNRIANNDDAGGTNSRIAIALPATGTYTIWANSFAAGATGNYTITVRQTSIAAVTSEGDRLVEQGKQQLNQGQIEEAVASFQQAITLFQSIEAGDRVAAIQQEILAAYQQQLAAFQAAEDLPGQFNTLSNIGSAYEKLRQYAQMQESFQQAVAVARQMEDPVAEAIATVRLAQSYQSQGNFEFLGNALFQPGLEAHQRGLELFQAALEIIPTIPNSEPLRAEIERQTLLGISNSYMGVSEAYNGLKQYAEAIEAAQQALVFAQQVDDQNYQINALNKLVSFYSSWGRQYRTEGNFEQALAAHQQALKYAQQWLSIAREIQDSNSINTALSLLDVVYFNIANIYSDQEQYQEAIEALEQELLINREMRDRPSEAGTLHLIANQYENLSQYSQALERYQQALLIYRNLRNPERELVALWSIGNVYFAWGRYPDALGQYQQALSIAQAQNYPGAEATTLIKIGQVYDAQGQYALALTQYQQALDTHRQIQQQLQQPDAIDRLSALCSYAPQYTSENSGDLAGYSQNLHRQLLEFSRIDCLKTSQYAESAALHSIGLVYRAQGRYPEALNLLQQSLAISVEYNDPSEQAPTLLEIGNVYTSQGQYTQALDYYQQALDIYHDAEIRYGESVTLNSMSSVYESQGRYAQALETNQQALEIARSIPSARLIQADALSFLGTNYDRLGQYEQALELHQQALTAYRAIGNRNSEAIALNDIGDIYSKQNQPDRALEYYQQALAIFQGIGAVANESSTLKNIGLVYQSQGQIDRAIPLFEQAIEIQQSIGAQARLADSLQGLGGAYSRQGNTEAALSSLQQALATYRIVGDRAGEALTLSSIGQVLAAQNQPEVAIVFYKQSVNITEQIRQELRGLSQEQQEAYTQTIADTYRQLADLLLQQDRIIEAQQVLDLLKVQELQDYLRDVRGTNSTAEGVPARPAEAAIQESVNANIDRIIALNQELAQLQQIPRDQRTAAQTQRLQELGTQQQTITTQFLAFINSPQIQQNIDRLRQTTDDQSINLEDFRQLQTELSQLPHTALFYPFVLDDRIELILVTENGVPIRQTVQVNRRDLNEAIRQFREALQDPTRDAIAPAQQLHQWLIEPLESALAAADIKTLIYAPDSQLRYIPLAALHDGHQWLVQRLMVNNITAASLTNLDALPHRDLSVFAGAVTEGRSVTVGNRTFTFQNLPYAGREVETLTQLVPDSRTVLNQDFTPSTSIEMNDYSIVHLATHATFVPGVAEQSFILFGSDGSTTGGYVTLAQIPTWNLTNVDLVVLSACETGVGDELGDGREILGLGYQMQRTGAKAVIASLWSVSDGGTQILMDAFYTAIENGYSKTEALQRAQQALITGDLTAVGASRGATVQAISTRTGLPVSVSNNLSHPYYWAPFILIGNGL